MKCQKRTGFKGEHSLRYSKQEGGLVRSCRLMYRCGCGGEARGQGDRLRSGGGAAVVRRGAETKAGTKRANQGAN